MQSCPQSGNPVPILYWVFEISNSNNNKSNNNEIEKPTYRNYIVVTPKKVTLGVLLKKFIFPGKKTKKDICKGLESVVAGPGQYTIQITAKGRITNAPNYNRFL